MADGGTALRTSDLVLTLVQSGGIAGLEMQAVLKEPAVVKRWEEIGAESSTMTPAEFTRFVQAEIDKWVPVVKASGAKPD